jgi:hypothetical protein
MGLTLIIVGLLISYFCWVQKRKIDHVERTENHENTIDTERLDRYSYKLKYTALQCGFYGGFIFSFIGLVLFISVIFQFIFR